MHARKLLRFLLQRFHGENNEIAKEISSLHNVLFSKYDALWYEIISNPSNTA